MKIKNFCLLVSLLLMLAACSADKPSGVISQSENLEYTASEGSPKNKSGSNYLAYVHQLNIELDSDKIADVHALLVSSCEQDQTFACVVLEAKLDAGASIRSSIKLRVKRAGVSHFSKLASTDGQVAGQSSTAEDLSAHIIDSTKRVEMLQSYRDKLLVLEAKPNADIDSLVKIASELAKVQSDLEFAQGKRAKLMQRVEADILMISLYMPVHRSYGSPIMEAIDDFSYNLEDGISSVISAAAYLIPWTVFLVLFLLLMRFIYRLFRRRPVSEK